MFDFSCNDMNDLRVFWIVSTSGIVWCHLDENSPSAVFCGRVASYTLASMVLLQCTTSILSKRFMAVFYMQQLYYLFLKDSIILLSESWAQLVELSRHRACVLRRAPSYHIYTYQFHIPRSVCVHSLIVSVISPRRSMPIKTGKQGRSGTYC